VNVFKMLLGGAKIEWENRYVEIRNQKLFLYAGQNYSKPLEVLELTSDLKIREIRRAESNGKAHVFEICCNKEQVMLCAATESILEKWLKVLRSMRDEFEQHKQLEKEQWKQEMS
jgi:hypothetical protein